MARPRVVSDEEILEAVREAVLNVGPHVSLDIVAERLGVTAPALLRRFGSRNDLLLAALRPDSRPPILDYIEAGPDARPLAEQLAELFTQASDFFATAVPALTALRESGIPVDALCRAPDAAPLRVLKALTGWIERAQKRRLLAVPDAQAAALAMLGSLQAPAFLRHLTSSRGPWDAARWARPLANLYLCGLAPSVKRTGTLPPPRASRGVRTRLRSKERS
jgi:AcrR family transcriptional regulator